MSPTAVAVEGLSVAYGSTSALDGIDLETARGTTLGVLGHNGDGTTTLIRVPPRSSGRPPDEHQSTASTSWPTPTRCASASPASTPGSTSSSPGGRTSS